MVKKGKYVNFRGGLPVLFLLRRAAVARTREEMPKLPSSARQWHDVLCCHATDALLRGD